MKAAFLAIAVLAATGTVLCFSATVHGAKTSGPVAASRQNPAASKAMSSKTLSLPMFFEPNQGQTAPQVKFLARGSGYALFLTADGQKSFERIKRLARQHEDNAIARLGPAKYKSLLRLLKEINEDPQD